ncbi:MAG: hypothetical protein AAB565_01325 [Patescibacteria group bacterium]
MAIEILSQKSQAKPFNSVKFLFYVSLILVILSLVSLLTLFFLKKNVEKSLEDTKAKIAEKETVEKKSREAEVLLAQKKINDFLFLLDLRRFNSKFFNSFQSITHPQIFFSKLELKMQEGYLLLSGTAENPIVLGQQILLFKKADYIKDVNLAKVSISKTGKINFDLSVSLFSEKFKH